MPFHLLQIQEHVQMLVSINVALILGQELVRSKMSTATAYAMFTAMQEVTVVLMLKAFVSVSQAMYVTIQSHNLTTIKHIARTCTEAGKNLTNGLCRSTNESSCYVAGGNCSCDVYCVVYGDCCSDIDVQVTISEFALIHIQML